MSTTTPPAHVPDEDVVAAVEEPWAECDPAAANGYLCRDQVADHCELAPATLKTRLRDLAAGGQLAASMTLDLRTYTETRAVAPLEVAQ